MEKKVPFSKRDQAATMAHMGPVFPLLLRESVDEGFSSYARSRAKDPSGWVKYGKSCRAGMLCDHIASAARELCTIAATNGAPELRWKVTENQRATEFLLGPFLVSRIKRIKKNRKDLTTSVSTRRQKAIRSESCVPGGQMSFDFVNDLDYLPMVDRVWVTVGFDLDELEESVSRVVIGAETRKRWIWRMPLLPAEPEVLASMPRQLADRIQDMRVRRTA